MEDGVQLAIAIMREWNWMGCDPKGSPIVSSIDVRDAVNRLAMEGHSDPEAAILDLLCSGDLLASCAYVWRSFRNGKHYEVDDSSGAVKEKYWNILRDSLNEEAERMDGKPYLPFENKLPELLIDKCPVHKWEPLESRGCFSRRSGHNAFIAPDYFEEWFSAWDIFIAPRSLEGWRDDVLEEPTVSAADKGGRPNAADWEAAALEMAGRYVLGELKPKRVSDVKKPLADWLGEYGRYPAPSTLHGHAKKIFEAIQKWEAAFQKP